MAFELNPEQAGLWATLSLLAFVIGLIIAVSTMSARALRYHRAHIRLPTLLKRDMVTKTGFLLPFLAIFAARFVSNALGISVALLGQNLIWLVFTTVPALIAIYVFDYYEIFVIDGTSHDAPLPVYELTPEERDLIDRFRAEQTAPVPAPA